MKHTQIDCQFFEDGAMSQSSWINTVLVQCRPLSVLWSGLDLSSVHSQPRCGQVSYSSVPQFTTLAVLPMKGNGMALGTWKCSPSTGKGREVAAHWFRWLRGSSSSHLERSTLLRTRLWEPKYGFIACDVSSDKLHPGSCLSWVSEGSGDVNCGVNPDWDSKQAIPSQLPVLHTSPDWAKHFTAKLAHKKFLMNSNWFIICICDWNQEHFRFSYILFPRLL